MRLSVYLYVILFCASPVWAATICRGAHGADFNSSTVSSPVTKIFVLQDNCPESHFNVRLVSPLTLRFGGQNQLLSKNKSIKAGNLPAGVAAARPPQRWEIRFDFDQAVLDQEDRGILDSIPSTSKARVDGYTCRLGEESYNLKLSTLRAAVVARYLKERGVNIVVQKGRGECCPVSEISLARNRRVVVLEVKK